ncbi:MAG: O-antigen ligase family protein [Planctomycetia bacterium]|nr:O-antigen ligase family protein [Planctomycetia bacterium]
MIYPSYMEFVVAIAAIIALIWGLILFERGGILAGCLAVMLAGCCFGAPFFSLPAGPIPLTLDRLLWVGLMAVYAIWRYRGRVESKPLGRAEIVLAAFFAVLVLSTLSHDWRWHHNQPLAHLVFFYLMPLGIYCAARECELSERTIRTVFGCLAIFGLYLAVTAVAEVHRQWWLVFPKYVTLPGDGQFFGRGRGPLLNPASCGFYQSVGLFAALLWWPRLNRPGRLALVAACGLFLLGIYSTYTRSVWLGSALGLMIVVGLWMPRAWRVPVLGGGLLLAVLVAGTQWERILAFKRDEGLSAQEAAESVKLRPILARIAWNMFCDRPMLGCGYGQYNSEHVNYVADRSTDLPLEKGRSYVQHNVFLALLTETGLVGMGLYVLLLVLWTRDAWRLWRGGLSPPWARQQGLLFLAMLGSYLVNAMFHDIALMPMGNMLLFFIAGITAGLRPATTTAPTP